MLHKLPVISDKAKRRILFLIAGVALIAAASIRWARLFEPIRNDEAGSFLAYAHHPLRYIAMTYDLPQNHFFYTMVVHVCYRLLGISELSVRLPAFISGITTLFLMGWLGWRLTRDLRVSLVATILCAFSTALVYYSISGRGYMFQCVFTLLLMAIAFAAIELPLNNTRKYLGALFCLSFLMIYTVPTGILFIAPLMVFLFVETRTAQKREIISVVAAIGIGLFIVFFPIRNQTGWSYSAGPMGSPLGAAASQARDMIQFASGGLMPVPVFIAFIGLGLYVCSRRYRHLVMYTYVLILFATLVMRNPMFPRTFVWFFPLLYLLIANGAVFIWDRLTRLSGHPLSGGCFAFLLFLVLFSNFLDRWINHPEALYLPAPHEVWRGLMSPAESRSRGIEERIMARVIAHRLTPEHRFEAVTDHVEGAFYAVEQRNFQHLYGLGWLTPDVRTVWWMGTVEDAKSSYQDLFLRDRWGPPMDCSKKGAIRIFCTHRLRQGQLITTPPPVNAAEFLKRYARYLGISADILTVLYRKEPSDPDRQASTPQIMGAILPRASF
jgi:hypothetical protein